MTAAKFPSGINDQFQKVYSQSITSDDNIVGDDNPFPVEPIAGPDSDFWLQVGKGEISGYVQLFIGGTNESVGTDFVTVVPWGTNYVFPTSQGTLTVASTSANDTFGGTGANLISINGLDDTYAELAEIVTMNGTSNVTTTNSFFRVNSVTVISSGSLNVNDGDITVFQGGNQLSQITATEGQSNVAVYTTPAGKTAFVKAFAPSLGKDDEIQIQSVVRFGSIDTNLVVSNTFLYQNNFIAEQQIPASIIEKSDYAARARKTGSAGSSRVSVQLELVLINNEDL